MTYQPHAFVLFTQNSYIDEQVREKAIKVDNAFKYRIEQAKTNAIDVGSTNILAKMTIESEGEIPDEVKNDVMNWHYL